MSPGFGDAGVLSGELASVPVCDPATVSYAAAQSFIVAEAGTDLVT
jgi:hypothetical protein